MSQIIETSCASINLIVSSQFSVYSLRYLGVCQPINLIIKFALIDPFLTFVENFEEKKRCGYHQPILF